MGKKILEKTCRIVPADHLGDGNHLGFGHQGPRVDINFEEHNISRGEFRRVHVRPVS